MGFLSGKKALIFGVLSDRSIAYGIAKKMHEQGAQLAFTYQNERFAERIKKLASEFDCSLTFPCDVTDDQQISTVFSDLHEHWDSLDILVHAVAYAPADQLKGDYFDCVNREGFAIAHDISSYSLAALAKAAYPMMEGHEGAIVALTYLGGERVVAGYNTMGIAKASLEANMKYLANSLGPKGIRVNCVSAGPIRTLAASGVKDFRKMLKHNETVSPMRRNVTIDEVGSVAAFLCSDLASGITGEVVHVDGGFHAIAIADANLD